MRIVLDTDVASNLIKNALDPALRAALAPHEAAITFVTVGELTRWSTVRDLGARRRAELPAYIAARVKIPAAASWPARGARSARTLRDYSSRASDQGRVLSRSRGQAPSGMIRRRIVLS